MTKYEIIKLVFWNTSFSRISVLSFRYGGCILGASENVISKDQPISVTNGDNQGPWITSTHIWPSFWLKFIPCLCLMRPGWGSGDGGAIKPLISTLWCDQQLWQMLRSEWNADYMISGTIKLPSAGMKSRLKIIKL